MKTFSELCETEKFPEIAALARWSTNYDLSTGTPFQFFCDMIGASQDEFGTTLVNGDPSVLLGYCELEYIRDAITEYLGEPDRARDFVHELLTSEDK